MSAIQDRFISFIGLYTERNVLLRDCVSEDDEDELVMAVDSCPEILLDILSVCDGQDSRARQTIFPYALRLLSASEIASYYRGFFRYGDQDGGAMKLQNRERIKQFHDHRVRADRWWQRGWIPFAGRISWLVIDQSPAANGKHGQIVHWNQECGIGNVVANDLFHLLEIVEQLFQFDGDLPRLDRIQ